MEFPQYRQSQSGNYWYKILSAEKMIMVYNLVSIVFRIEICKNSFLVKDALQDEYAKPSTKEDFESHYYQAKHKIENEVQTC